MFAFLRAFKRTDPALCLAQIASGEMVLVDLREAHELRATGHAAEALHVPLGQLRHAADPASTKHHQALDPQRPVALYCATGARSAQGAMLLRKLGYRDVHNLGGLSHWQAAGGGVTP